MHVRRALALAVAGPLFLVGCTGDPEPTPKIPDPTAFFFDSFAHRVRDAGGRECGGVHPAVGRRSREMQATGETEEFRALSARTASRAADSLSECEAIYDAGGTIEWDGWTIMSI